MKIGFLCIAIFLSFGGCANAELEFYPDYRKPDAADENWVKDQALNPNFQPYFENQRQFLFPQDRAGLPYLNALHKFRQADLTWPNVAAENRYKNQQLAHRISEISRKFEEMHRRPQYFFKTHGGHKLNHYNIFDAIDDKNEADFELNYKPNSHILDDVRSRPNDESMELSLPNDDYVNFEPYMASNEPKQGSLDKNQMATENVNSKIEFENVKTADDPTEFAYPPSDARYFEDETTDRIKTSNINEKKLEKEDSFSSGTSFNEIKNRNNNYRNQQLLPVISNVKHQVIDSSDVVAIKPHQDDTTGVYIIAIVAGISAAATVGLIAFGIGWYKLKV